MSDEEHKKVDSDHTPEKKNRPAFSFQFPQPCFQKIAQRPLPNPEKSQKNIALTNKVSQKPNIHCILEASDENTNGLFLGNLKAAKNLSTLKSNKIRAVLTVSDTLNITYPKYYVPADDIEYFDLSIYFDEGFKFINEKIKHTNVLVHCHAGVSRSATFVIAYLIKYKNMKLDDAFKFVKEKRKIISPNVGFMRQLKEFDNFIQMSKEKENKDNCIKKL